MDDLKAAGDGGYKEKYEKEHSDFEAYKSGITEKESKAAKVVSALNSTGHPISLTVSSTAFLPRHTDAAYGFYRYSYFFMRDAGVLYSHYTDACAP